MEVRSAQVHATVFSFWSDAILVDRLEIPHLFRLVRRSAIFATFALIMSVLAHYSRYTFELPVAPFQIAGAGLSLLLVLRTNGGYDRWWEGRKLWGSVTNHTRSLGAAALAYVPGDAAWRADFLRWVIAFPHAMRRALRGEHEAPELIALIGAENAARAMAADHMPLFVATEIARRLHDAVKKGQLDSFAFLQMDRDRAALLDHIGGCERILKSPMPWGYVVMLRHFLLVFLTTLPFALHRDLGWMTPVVMLFVAFPLLSLDEIASELQNPFASDSMDRLPLEKFCSTIERNLLSLVDEKSA